MDHDRRHAELTARIGSYVDALCAFQPDRHVGSEGNREATAWLAERFSAAGLEVQRIGFDCVDWRAGHAQLTAGTGAETLSFELKAGPYSPGAELHGARVVAAASLEDLQQLQRGRGQILLVHGALAKEQLVPRNYPFYRSDAHTAIIAELDRLEPGAIVALTGANPGAVGALSPFPWAEDADFGHASAFAHESLTEEMLALVGGAADVVIDSEQVPARGEQIVATLAGTQERVVVSAHVDARFGTPGALDNAASVATIVALAEELGAASAGGGWAGPTIEFAPFNGEDNFAAYGEMAYLAQAGDLADVRLAINLDAAGYQGAATHVSFYGVPEALAAYVSRRIEPYDTISEGPAWPQSDHMVFAMRGVPALAITTSELGHVAAAYTHTERDVPAIVDASLLADVVEFLATLVTGI